MMALKLFLELIVQTLWNRKLVASNETAAHSQSMLIDFLKMFVAAILCGLGCSIAVAGVALLLSGNADAATPVEPPAIAPAHLPRGTATVPVEWRNHHRCRLPVKHSRI